MEGHRRVAADPPAKVEPDALGRQRERLHPAIRPHVEEARPIPVGRRRLGQQHKVAGSRVEAAHRVKRDHLQEEVRPRVDRAKEGDRALEARRRRPRLVARGLQRRRELAERLVAELSLRFPRRRTTSSRSSAAAARPVPVAKARPVAPRDARPVASREARPVASREARPVASREAHTRPVASALALVPPYGVRAVVPLYDVRAVVPLDDMPRSIVPLDHARFVVPFDDARSVALCKSLPVPPSAMHFQARPVAATLEA